MEQSPPPFSTIPSNDQPPPRAPPLAHPPLPKNQPHSMRHIFQLAFPSFSAFWFICGATVWGKHGAGGPTAPATTSQQKRELHKDSDTTSVNTPSLVHRNMKQEEIDRNSNPCPARPACPAPSLDPSGPETCRCWTSTCQG